MGGGRKRGEKVEDDWYFEDMILYDKNIIFII